MALTVMATLRCDGCSVAYPLSCEYAVPVLRGQLEELRDKAHARGWRRYRLTHTGPFGDYCPKCIKVHEARKAAKGGAR